MRRSGFDSASSELARSLTLVEEDRPDRFVYDDWEWDDDRGREVEGVVGRYSFDGGESGDQKTYLQVWECKSKRQAIKSIGRLRGSLNGPYGLVTAIVAQAAMDYLSGGEFGDEAGRFLASDDCRMLVEMCGGRYVWPCALELLRAQ